MKSIFLSNNKENIKRVFSDTNNACFLSSLSFDYCYSKEQVLNNPAMFSDVAYIFSTWNMPIFTIDEIKGCFPSLKAIFYAAGTVKYFAKPFLDCGIKIFSAAKVNAIPVAELSASLILLANKGYFQAQREYRRPFWKFSHKRARLHSSERSGNYNANVGIIGCGNIGRLVISKLKDYDLNIFVNDPFLSKEDSIKLGVKQVSLDELFSNCNVISLHLPDIPSTRGIINYSLLSKMKDYATIINTGRGNQVVEKDLVKALRKKKNRCAVLDVTIREPIFPWSPLRLMKNIFLTPHIAGSMGNEEKRLGLFMVSVYNKYVNGIIDDSLVTKEMLDHIA